ncbi:hypothetical protein [Shinella sp.]|uniref:hypothetical protein n=1 Tax=Shinella sp. TaxID=1870904 RepID=UPI002590D5B2|nr:hypothetical protein [Shinella sp.]MCW5710640.1 hypothetical protein [Shinella sp.]
MYRKAINALRTSVTKLPPLAPLAGLELAIKPGVLTLQKENTDILIGIACSFPVKWTSSDLLEAIDRGEHHLVEVLKQVDVLNSPTRGRARNVAAFEAGFDAVDAFMGVAIEASDSLPLAAAE